MSSSITLGQSNPATTAAKSFVGKKDLNEALVGSWHPVSDHAHMVTVDWPASHKFYTPFAQAHSPLLFTESVRQALALVSHTAYQIPMDRRMGWEYFRSDVSTRELRTRPGPTQAELRVTHTEVNVRKLGTAFLTANVEGTLDGAYLGSADIRYSAHPPDIYNRLRGKYADAHAAFADAIELTVPVVPTHAGRATARDVVLSPADRPGRWQLRVDTSHSVLFDHPHDHIPGMVLLEAVSQAAQAMTAPGPTVVAGFDTTFHRYVEFDAPCLLTAETMRPDPHGRTRLRVDAEQNGRLAFTSLVTIQPDTTR